MKIVTLCGSLKFQKLMMEVAEKMARKGFCVLTPVFPVLENDPITEEQLQKMIELYHSASTHPDENDLQNVRNFVQTVLKQTGI